MLAVAVAPAQAPARAGGGPDAAERCARAAALLAPVAAATLAEREPGDEAWPTRAGVSRPLKPGPEWLALEGYCLRNVSYGSASAGFTCLSFEGVRPVHVVLFKE